MDELEDAVPAWVPHCTYCGSTSLELSFVYSAMDNGGVSRLRWYSGLYQKSVWGLREKSQRRKGVVDTYRCEDCSHLELFVRLE